MLDVDGTLIPYEYDALPSPRVVTAIKKAKEIVKVVVVTGRSYRATKRILESFEIHEGYAVVDGGAYVIDLATEKPIFEKFIEKSDLQLVKSVFEDEGVDFFVKDKKSFNGTRDHYDPYIKGQELKDVSMIFTDELYTLEKTEGIIHKLATPTMTIFMSKHKDPHKYSFNITHSEATKMHGIAEVEKLLGISKTEIIGVGDGYNDFPLLMGSGLKVAMGNAISELKDYADFVTEPVDKDGVAVVIEKYILNS